MKERALRSYVDAALNKEIGADSITQLGVSQLTRAYADIVRAQDSREFSGLLIGIVKEWRQDYIDPKTKQPIRGVVKVFIPSNGTPLSTRTGDPSSEDDTGWYTCFPIYPFAGSSVAGNSDGNSHGFDYAPALETAVAIMHADANTKTGYWFGCIPTVPGMVDGPSAPTNEQVRDSDRPGYAQVSNKPEKPRPTVDKNLTEAGLGYDKDRGPTPKTDRTIAKNTIGFALRSIGKPAENILGHQFVMNDDDEYRGIRLQTSEGNQLLLHDANGCIYINTKHGKNWIELREDGDVFIYSKTNINIAAQQDIGFFCGRDFLLDVGRDFNLRVKENFTTEIGKGYHATVVEEYRIDVKEGVHWTVGEGYAATVGEGFDLKVGETIKLEAGEQFHIKAASNIKINSNVRVDTQAGADSAAESQAPETVKLQTVPGEPTPEQYRKGRPGSNVQVLGNRDSTGDSSGESGQSSSGQGTPSRPPRPPRHEPWEPAQSSSATFDNTPTTGNFSAPDPGKVQGLPFNNGNSQQTAGPGNLPYGYRNNNPGAVLNPSNAYRGKAGKEGAMQKFENMKYGFAGQTRAWNNNMRAGLTPRQIACNYTPDNCSDYGAALAAATGVDPDVPLTQEQINDPDFRYNWQKRAACWENGIPTKDFDKWFDGQDLSDGLAMEGITKGNSGQEVGDTVDPKSSGGPGGSRGKKPAETNKRNWREEQRQLLRKKK